MEKKIYFINKKTIEFALLVWFPQAAGIERAAPPAERGAEGPAAAEQQAAAAERADLPAL